MTAIAFVTCADIPDGEADDRLADEHLAAFDITVEPAVWDDPMVDWSRYALSVLRSPWDYAHRRDAFVAWAHTVPRLVNDAATVAWNTDKRYLAGLAAAGIPVVPTTWISPGESFAPADSGEYVVKPAVSSGSRDTGRYDLADADHRDRATEHARRLLTAGRTVMIQPYLDAVDTYGETALIFLSGVFSHAIRKGPMLQGPDVGMRGLYKEEEITPREPSAAEHALAARVMAALPEPVGTPLYARVDLLAGPDGAPMLIELELTEPSLFLAHGRYAPATFAAAIASRL